LRRGKTYEVSPPMSNHTTTIAVSLRSSFADQKKNFQELESYSGQTAGSSGWTIIAFGGAATLPPCRTYEPRHTLPGGVRFVRCGLSIGRMIMGHEAKKYLGYAQECVRQAEQAHTQERRGKLIELARVWMAAAVNEEAAKRKGLSPSGLPRIAS
jgi:hypothetical protein